MRKPLIAAAALLALGGTAFAADPIRIGLVLPYSAGPFVPIANEMTEAFMMALEERGMEIDGHKIEVLKEDTTHKPDIAQAKAKKLVFEDKAALLVGPVASNELTALFDFAGQSKTPLVIPNAGDNEVTGEKCSPWVLRSSFSNDQIVREMGPWLLKKGYKSAYLIAFDYKAGHQLMDGFKGPYEKAGGKIAGESFPPFGPIADFGPYLAKIKEAKPDAVFTFFAGPPATAFVKQYAEFGLKDAIKLTGTGWLISPLNLPQEGAAAAGVIGILNYVPAIDTPVNEAFQKKWQAAHGGRVASEFAAQGYDTALLIHAALDAVKGKTGDKAALVKAMHGVTVQGTRGPLKIDPKTNNVIQDIFIYEAKQAGAGIDLTVLDKIPQVQDPPNGCKLG
jgi:branched-chain amino acid transport system substrate-binding protein